MLEGNITEYERFQEANVIIHEGYDPKFTANFFPQTSVFTDS